MKPRKGYTHDQVREEIRAYLNRKRWSHGDFLRELADTHGLLLSRQFLSDWLSGRKKASPRIREAVGHALGMKLEDGLVEQ